jgi:ribonuclease III family protein
VILHIRYFFFHLHYSFHFFTTFCLPLLAEHQSRLLHKLRQENNLFVLSIKEIQVMNRGRNAATNRKSNNHRHHPILYQDSTAFEALVGYLYISDMNRCIQLFRWIEANIDTV